jgi:cutinase
MHAAIPKLSQEVRNQIAGVVLFGDTRYSQESKKIRGLTEDKFKIFCNDGDQVCKGTLSITNAHFEYAPKVPAAVEFLTSAVAKVKPGIGGGASGGGSDMEGMDMAPAKPAKGTAKGSGGMSGSGGHSHGGRSVASRDGSSYIVDKYQGRADGTTFYQR